MTGRASAMLSGGTGGVSGRKETGRIVIRPYAGLARQDNRIANVLPVTPTTLGIQELKNNRIVDEPAGLTCWMPAFARMARAELSIAIAMAMGRGPVPSHDGMMVGRCGVPVGFLLGVGRWGFSVG